MSNNVLHPDDLYVLLAIAAPRCNCARPATGKVGSAYLCDVHREGGGKDLPAAAAIRRLNEYLGKP